MGRSLRVMLEATTQGEVMCVIHGMMAGGFWSELCKMLGVCH